MQGSKIRINICPGVLADFAVSAGFYVFVFASLRTWVVRDLLLVLYLLASSFRQSGEVFLNPANISGQKLAPG